MVLLKQEVGVFPKTNTTVLEYPPTLQKKKKGGGGGGGGEKRERETIGPQNKKSCNIKM